MYPQLPSIRSRRFTSIVAGNIKASIFFSIDQTLVLVINDAFDSTWTSQQAFSVKDHWNSMWNIDKVDIEGKQYVQMVVMIGCEV